MLSTIFCAVPAFIRVEPERASGPTPTTISIPAARPHSEPHFATLANLGQRPLDCPGHGFVLGIDDASDLQRGLGVQPSGSWILLLGVEVTDRHFEEWGPW